MLYYNQLILLGANQDYDGIKISWLMTSMKAGTERDIGHVYYR